jgi:hypothetical protein
LNLRRGLIFTQSLECGVSQVPIRCPTAKFDLRDQFRLQENEHAPFGGCKGIGERRPVGAQTLHLPVQRLRGFLREASARSPHMHKLSVVIVTERKRTDGIPSGCRWRIATNHEFFAVRAFALNPFPVTARPVGSVSPLADNAFKAETARVIQHGLAVGNDVLGVAQ